MEKTIQAVSLSNVAVREDVVWIQNVTNIYTCPTALYHFNSPIIMPMMVIYCLKRQTASETILQKVVTPLSDFSVFFSFFTIRLNAGIIKISYLMQGYSLMLINVRSP